MRRTLLTVIMLAPLSIPTASSAIEHAVSGHVNRMIRFGDDGKASDIQHLDNESSRTRLRWRGTGDIGRGIKAGIYVETSVASSRSSRVGLKADDDGAGADTNFDLRHSAVSFSSQWGLLRIGHTSAVSDGSAQADLSGDTLFNWVEGAADHAGAIAWRTSDGGTVTGGSCAAACDVGDARSDFDGPRVDVLRYDTPPLGPATIGAAIWNDNGFDLGASLRADLGGGELLLRGAWAKRDQRDNFQQWATSGSYLFSQGTSFTFSVGGRDFNKAASTREDALNWYLKLAHSWDNNVASIGYGRTEDLITRGAESSAFSIGFLHNIPRPGVELYAGWRWHELDLDATARATLGFTGPNGSRSIEDINVFVVGSRIRFN